MIFFISVIFLIDSYFFFFSVYYRIFLMLLLGTMFQKCCLNHILQDFHILQRPLINIELLDVTAGTSSGSRSQTISDVPNLLTQ